MSWKQFCDLGNVPKWYQSVDYQTLRIPERADGDSFVRMAKSFIDNPRSLVLRGEPGRGKTHFSYALMRGLLDHKRCGLADLRFFRSKSLDDKILAEIYTYKSSVNLLEEVKSYPFLFLDDFGIEREGDRTSRDYYDIIDSRLYNMKTTVISTNLTDKAISHYFTDRMFSRLKEFVWIEFDGPDLRGGNSL